jgi:hypothetical protein
LALLGFVWLCLAWLCLAFTECDIPDGYYRI